MTQTLDEQLNFGIIGVCAPAADIPNSEKVGQVRRPAQPTQLNEMATCAVCFHQGVYGVEIINVAYRDRLGHDSTRLECRDIEACLNRKGY